jgi:hypothetical protein
MHAIEQRHESSDRYMLFTGLKSAQNLQLYQKPGYHEFKRVSVNDWLTMVFLEKYNQYNNNQQQRK